jgi:hypothetical protein
MNKQTIWFAVVLARSEIGFPLEVPITERQQHLNWVRRRGQTLLGEFTSRSSASRAVQRWLSTHRSDNMKLEQISDCVIHLR